MVKNTDFIIVMNLQREEKTTDAVSVTICPVSHHHTLHSLIFYLVGVCSHVFEYIGAGNRNTAWFVVMNTLSLQPTSATLLLFELNYS